ncbi:hypothetical protein ACFLTV_01370 [Chloroflexota bacterium]
MTRTWIKLYCDQWLSGTLREETAELRGVFADLLALAGSGKYGDTGTISLQNGVGLTDLQFEKLLKITKFQWRKCKRRLISTDRIEVNSDNVVTIINWKKYQSEYERQRPYRNQKLHPKVSTDDYTGDRDIDIDGERKEVRIGNTRKSWKVVN